MLGDRYVVQKGDNLWKIASVTLGGGKEWPRIWKYNNRREVTRMTGRAVPDPDVIYVGQVLIIPRLAAIPVTRPANPDPPPTGDLPVAREPSTAAPASNSSQPQRSAGESPAGGRTLRDQAERIRMPLAFKYDLEPLAWPPQDVGLAVVQVKMTGTVLLASKQTYAASYVLSRSEVEAQVTREANQALGKLVSENSYTYDRASRRVTVKSMLVSQSNLPNSAATAIGVEMASGSLAPKLRAEIRLPKLEGTIDNFRFTALDAAIVLEVTPKPPTTSSQPRRVVQAPAATEPAAQPTAWAAIAAAGLVAAGAALIVATIVEDFVTLGAGTVDDPASFALAGAAFATALSTLGKSSNARMPRAIAPISIAHSTRFTVQGEFH
jgi:hypothetical protein